MSKKPSYKFSPFQRAWIDALKHGNLRQVQGQLHLSYPAQKTAAYCCLGVACKLAKPYVGELDASRISRGRFVDVKYDAGPYCLPSQVEEELKLNDNVGKLVTPEIIHTNGIVKVAESLANLNDLFGWTFKQIGEYIENNPHNVFKD